MTIFVNLNCWQTGSDFTGYIFYITQEQTANSWRYRPITSLSHFNAPFHLQGSTAVILPDDGSGVLRRLVCE